MIEIGDVVLYKGINMGKEEVEVYFIVSKVADDCVFAEPETVYPNKYHRVSSFPIANCSPAYDRVEDYISLTGIEKLHPGDLVICYHRAIGSPTKIDVFMFQLDKISYTGEVFSIDGSIFSLRSELSITPPKIVSLPYRCFPVRTKKYLDMYEQQKLV